MGYLSLPVLASSALNSLSVSVKDLIRSHYQSVHSSVNRRFNNDEDDSGHYNNPSNNRSNILHTARSARTLFRPPNRLRAQQPAPDPGVPRRPAAAALGGVGDGVSGEERVAEESRWLVLSLSFVFFILSCCLLVVASAFLANLIKLPYRSHVRGRSFSSITSCLCTTMLQLHGATLTLNHSPFIHSLPDGPKQ